MLCGQWERWCSQVLNQEDFFLTTSIPKENFTTIQFLDACFKRDALPYGLYAVLSFKERYSSYSLEGIPGPCVTNEETKTWVSSKTQSLRINKW